MNKDLERDRFYEKENEDERYTSSGELKKSSLRGKVACTGLASVFAQVLSDLEINNIIETIENKETGELHARNIACIDDEKYDIHGVYSFDASWENESLESYKYFAIQKDLSDKYSFKFRNNNLKEYNTN